MELPYGEFKASYHFRNRQSDSDEKLDLPEQQLEYLKARIEPIPVSAEQQKSLDIAEEEENKRKEHEARMAQKKIEEEKARHKYEQQQLIAKQE